MFSSTDGDRNYPTQWALNPSAYQNMSNDQVDWAALAQQWIMMKETCPPEQVPPAPPPPSIGPVKKESTATSNSSLIEGGEAPMEVENEKDESDAVDSTIPPASWTGPAAGPGSWNWQQQQWGWNAGWTGTAAIPAPTAPAVVPPAAMGKGALLPTPYGFPAADTAVATAGFSGYAPGYWTSGAQPNRGKGNKKHRGESDDEPENTTVTIDAAKRRQLPAWIREGLEKMEREKQKQLDKEREAREREEYLKRKKQEEEEVRKVMTDSGLVTLPTKSKFESDSEDSDKEDGRKLKRETPPAPKFINKKKESAEPESPVSSKSREERVQDMMLTVRRMMTEILLDVTTEEIENICQEELKRYKASASAMNLQKTPALASLTGKLGLGIYGESGSSASDSEHSNADDSDTNLKETIRRRKAEFVRTEREIEARALDAERRQAEHERVQREREEREHSSSGNVTKDGERYSQVETANSHYGNSEKSATRKSRFHDGPINDGQTSKHTDHNAHGGEKHKSGNKTNTNNNKSRKRNKSSSSRSRSSSLNSRSKSETSSESDSSDRRSGNRSRRHSVSDDYRKSERNRNDVWLDKHKRNRSRDRDSRSESVDYTRSGNVYKESSESKVRESTKRNKSGNSEEDRTLKYVDYKNESPEHKSTRTSRREESLRQSYSPLRSSRRSHSREHSTRSHRRSRSRERRSRSRHRSRSVYSRERSRERYSRRSSSKEYNRRKRSSSRDRRRRSRSYDRRDRSRSRDRYRSKSRDYYRRSRSRSQPRGKKSHRH